MDPEVEFRKLVRDALEHLYDTAYLETHPLLSQFPKPAVDSRLTRAQNLRTLLKETIEALRPQEGSAAGSPEWRSYLALRHRYVQGMSQGETEIELGISLRQLQRELHKGLDAVSALVAEKRVAAPRTVPDETQDLQNELDQWAAARARCEVQSLVDDTLWMVKPMLEERGVAVQMVLPADLKPVLVDATLTRQALFLILRVLIRNTRTGTLILRARDDQDHGRLALSSSTRVAYEAEPDWQAALLICQRQGVTLDAHTGPDGGIEMVLGLPRATPRRVLVVDDNAALHQLFERYLTPHQYEVIHAYGGDAALELAIEQHPDAITLDVMMPNVDGWQVLRGLAENPATATIPIIICSVLKEPALAFSLGARAYLKKPVDRLELVATLARLLTPVTPAAAGSPPMPEDN
jgi:CheY-like chemotaxis protein